MAKQPKTYVSTQPVYVNSTYTPAGEPFVTDAPKGENWKAIGEDEASALQASADEIPADQSLDELPLAALQALAAEKRVKSAGLSKAKLIDAIKAADEPRL